MPAGLREETTLWQRVASVDYLLAELPRLVAAGLPEDVQRAGRAEVPATCDPQPGPDRDRPRAVDDALETRDQRLRHHIR